MSKRRRESDGGLGDVDAHHARRSKLLTGTSWWLYRAAPLHAFDQAALATYAKELAALLSLSHGTGTMVAPSTPGLRHSFVELSLYRNLEAATPALRMILSPYGAPHASVGDKDFAFFPLVLARGPVAMRKMAVAWVERRFDALVQAARMVPHQLSELLSAAPPLEGGHKALELLYDCSHIHTALVRGVRHFSVTLSANEARALLHAGDDTPLLTALASHVQGASSIKLSSLALVRVSTPAYIIGTEGRLKLFATADLERLLGLVGELCTP